MLQIYDDAGHEDIPLEGKLDRRDAEHLVRRTGFGLRSQQVEEILGMTRAQAVDHIMDFSSNPPASPPAVIFNEEESRWSQIRDLTKWWINRMQTVPRGLEEKLVLFWHSHFASSADSVSYAWQTWDQNKLFRDQALGNFGQLAHAMSVQPAMLTYLDNYRNKAGNPNENFARELFELHILGVGNYTEADIVGAAKAWTGHMLSEDRRNYEFHPWHHDYRDKTIFGITRDWDGPALIDEVLKGSKKLPAARYLARKLFEYLAYQGPDESVVATLADYYLANDLSIGLLVRAILLHDEFWSERARFAYVRSPVEYAVACLIGAGSSEEESRPDWWLDTMGQELFYPPNPSGWHLNGYWISATSMWAKAGFARHVAWKAVDRDHLAEILTMGAPQAVSLVLSFFGLPEVSTATRRALEDYVYAERATDEWPLHANLLTLVMLTPEMQLA